MKEEVLEEEDARLEHKQSLIRHLDNKGNSGALPHLVPSTHSLSPPRSQPTGLG